MCFELATSQQTEATRALDERNITTLRMHKNKSAIGDKIE